MAVANVFSIRRIFQQSLELGKDLLFPKHCLNCQKEGQWLCSACWGKLRLEINPQFFCPVCYRDNPDGRACGVCRSSSFLDGAMALAPYSQPIVAKTIQLVKYNFAEEVSAVWNILIKNLGGDALARFVASTAVITPVPLHRRRLLERGFNQAEIFGRLLSAQCGQPMDAVSLMRCRATRHQVGLNGEERRRNLAGSFAIVKPLPAKQIILVDDVFTTGSTFQECARVLKEAGAEEVRGVTVARER